MGTCGDMNYLPSFTSNQHCISPVLVCYVSFTYVTMKFVGHLGSDSRCRLLFNSLQEKHVLDMYISQF